MNTNQEVEQYFQIKDHPMTEEKRLVRDIILASDSRVSECIKWKVPTFMYKGNIASFMNAKKFVSLMFHKGALIDDKTGLLEGEGKEARVARFYNIEDIENKRTQLEAVIQSWIALKDKI